MSLGAINVKILPTHSTLVLTTMPDYGTRVSTPALARQRIAHPSLQNDEYGLLASIPTNGTITGVVKLEGVAAAGVMLRLYARESGLLLDQIKSGAGGVYTFVGLNPDYAKGYQVMALDPQSSAPHAQTLVHDHVWALAAP